MGQFAGHTYCELASAGDQTARSMKKRSYCPIHKNGDSRFYTMRMVCDHYRVQPSRIMKLWEDGWITAAERDQREQPIFGASQIGQVRGMLEACGDV